MKLQQVDENTFVAASKKHRNLVTQYWFDPNYWKEQDAIVGESRGRGVTYFFKHQNKSYVLRNYLRGGLIGKLVKERYWYSGIKQTRAYNELRLLKKMRKMKLPVPKPVAMLVKKESLTYKTSIIIRLIKNTKDVFHVLQERRLISSEWHKIGVMIRAFHDAGINHVDLNIHNILLNDKGKFWLIDFDKGEFIEPNHPQLEKNLERLQRSLRKELGQNEYFHWQEADWEALLSGYQGKSI